MTAQNAGGVDARHVVIGQTRCYGEDAWFREVTIDGVLFLTPLDDEDKARRMLKRAVSPDAATVDDAAVERACRVVAERAGEDWDTLGDFTRDTLRETQRAALQAARVPDGGTTYDEWRISEERTKLQAANLALAADLATANENLRMAHLALESAQSRLSVPDGAGGKAVAIVGWVHEDELPEGYPYDAMFPFSKVDIVRMFPVYAPSELTPVAGEAVRGLVATFKARAKNYEDRARARYAARDDDAGLTNDSIASAIDDCADELERALAVTAAPVDKVVVSRRFLANLARDVGDLGMPKMEKALQSLLDGSQGDGPDYPDGCSREGFIGGCERMGCHEGAVTAAPGGEKNVEVLGVGPCPAHGEVTGPTPAERTPQRGGQFVGWYVSDDVATVAKLFGLGEYDQSERFMDGLPAPSRMRLITALEISDSTAALQSNTREEG